MIYHDVMAQQKVQAKKNNKALHDPLEKTHDSKKRANDQAGWSWIAHSSGSDGKKSKKWLDMEIVHYPAAQPG